MNRQDLKIQFRSVKFVPYSGSRVIEYRIDFTTIDYLFAVAREVDTIEFILLERSGSERKVLLIARGILTLNVDGILFRRIVNLDEAKNV
jgi:hypothetical protein